MDNSRKSFFVTGGTGLIGTNLISRILQRFPDSTVTLLVRASNDTDVVARLNALVQQLESSGPGQGLRERVRGVRGDIMDDGLGLSDRETARLVRETTHIIHGAATIRFDHPIEEARRINCGGTKRMLAIARQCVEHGKLEQFVYIGTSSVSGRRAGNVFEHELEMGQQFFNTYEQSKCESERMVRDNMQRIPTVIFRPSIVIGDSRTGRTSTFNVIYIPLRLLDRGLLTVIPGSASTTLDLVPVDWVCDVMVFIMALNAANGTICHVTAGPGRATLLGEVVERAVRYFNLHHPLGKDRTVSFISQEVFTSRLAVLSAREQALLTQLDTLLPYIGIDRLFDSATTDAFLKGSGISFPDFRNYADHIFAYCLKTAWGKGKA